MNGEDGGAVGLSVVVPVYRTGWALPELARRVREVAAAEGLRHELVVVDDASPDDAREVAARLASQDPAVRYLPLAENLGQHRAVLAGMAAARGDWVVVMDGDLQDPPEAVPALLRRAREGHHAVFAARTGRYQSRFRMLTSRWFKRILARRTGVPPGSGMYFLASRRLVDRIATCDDPRPFVVALVGLAGLPVSSVPVERARRRQGSSAYSGWRRLRAGLSALAFVRRRRAGSSGPEAPWVEPATPWRVRAPLAVGAGVLTVVWVVVKSRGGEFSLADGGFRYLLSRAWADGEGLFSQYQLRYVPGQYVYVGTFLRYLGPSVETLRLAQALLGGAAVAVLTGAVGRIARPPLTAVTGLTLAFLAVPGHATIASAAVFALALDLAIRRVVGRGWVFGTAVLAGCLVGWREDSAVLLLGVVTLAVVLRRRPGDLVRLVLPGAVLGFVPWVAVFALRGEGLELLAHVGHRLLFLVDRLGAPTHPKWRFPRDPFASFRSFKTAVFPLLAATPPVLYLALLIREGVRWRRTGEVRWWLVAAATTGLAYLPQFLWERPGPGHFRAHLHLLVAVSAVAAASLASRPRRVAAAALLLLSALVAYRTVLARPSRALVPYPCCEGRRIDARLPGKPPPWAGVAAATGDGTLVVLGWGPGWYVLEGVRPATRLLYSGERGLDGEEVAELVRDLTEPSVRWVLVRGRGIPYPEPMRALRALYEPREEWRTWRLWERLPSSSPPPAAPPGSS